MERIEKYDTYSIPVDRIWFDEDFNCRHKFSPMSVQALSESIAEKGLEFPIIVQPIMDLERAPGGYDYRLIAGHRRFVAATVFLKWDHIPANIRTGMSERDAQILNLTENLERSDLNPLEEAMAIAKRFPEGTPLRAVSKEMKRDTRWVHQRLKLLRLPYMLQEKVATGILTLLDVEFLDSLRGINEQLKVAAQIEEARAGQKAGKKSNLPAELRRKFRARLTKGQINAWVAKLHGLGINGLILRFAALITGYISEDEFMADVEAEILKKSEKEVNSLDTFGIQVGS